MLFFLMLPAPVQAQWWYGTVGNQIIIGGCACPCGAVEIPDRINGLPVAGIEDRAFANYTCLTSVTIPSSVTNIGEWAFAYCSDLASVTIGNSVISNRVASIGYSAFYYCTNLTSVTIGNSVANIGNSAFYSCTSLTSVTIGNSVTSIGNSAFYSCTSLTNLTIPAGVTSFGVPSGPAQAWRASRSPTGSPASAAMHSLPAPA